jgi:hypothetical protein
VSWTLPPVFFSILMSSLSTVILPSAPVSATALTARTVMSARMSLYAEAPFEAIDVRAIRMRVSLSLGLMGWAMPLRTSRAFSTAMR